MQKLTIQVVCAYMLKAVKLGIDVSKFNAEFKAIRHGNYSEFIALINGPIPRLVVYSDKNLDEIDFVGLLQSGPSLLIFREKCFTEFGVLLDNDIADETYEKLVLFEISLKMHASNDGLIVAKETLSNIIDKISVHKNLSVLETEKLHEGRKFLNMVKHFKSQFSDWQTGVMAFNATYKIVEKHDLKIL